jgi:hypothetical protein
MDGKQIQEVTAEGIRYIDENGDEQFIDFKACYQNYERSRTSAEYRERITRHNSSEEAWNRHLEHVEKWKEVGRRHFSMRAEDCYIEFFTEPPTRLVFKSPTEFMMVQRLTQKVGWHTYDLT